MRKHMKNCNMRMTGSKAVIIGNIRKGVAVNESRWFY